MCVNSFGCLWNSVSSAKVSLACHGSAVQGEEAAEAAYGDDHFLPCLVGQTLLSTLIHICFKTILGRLRVV